MALEVCHASATPGKPLCVTRHTMPFDLTVELTGEDGEQLEARAVVKDVAVVSQETAEGQRTLRAEVLHRDLYSCEECGGRATEVHHAIPLTPENIDDPTVALNPALLHSLCHDCHAAITLGRADCADGFFFDADGQLTPREG